MNFTHNFKSHMKEEKFLKINICERIVKERAKAWPPSTTVPLINPIVFNIYGFERSGSKNSKGWSIVNTSCNIRNGFNIGAIITPLCCCISIMCS